jgi:hypothetical protein
MQIAYICSPYRVITDDRAMILHNRNIDYAKELTKKALDAGLAPITPHLYITQVADDDVYTQRQQGINAGLALLRGCDFLILGDHYGISAGMKSEIEKARALNITIITEQELDTLVNLERNCKGGMG